MRRAASEAASGQCYTPAVVCGTCGRLVRTDRNSLPLTDTFNGRLFSRAVVSAVAALPGNCVLGWRFKFVGSKFEIAASAAFWRLDAPASDFLPNLKCVDRWV